MSIMLKNKCILLSEFQRFKLLKKWSPEYFKIYFLLILYYNLNFSRSQRSCDQWIINLCITSLIYINKIIAIMHVTGWFKVINRYCINIDIISFFFQLHTVSRTQQGRQRKPSVKTLCSLISVNIWRHCVFSGGTQHRAFPSTPEQRNENINVNKYFISIEHTLCPCATTGLKFKIVYI